MTFPTALDISRASCSGITCSIISPSITTTFSNSTSTPYQISFVINGVINAASYEPIPNFMVYLNSYAGFQSLKSSIGAWTNNIASNFVTTVSTGNAYLGESALFTFLLTGLTASQTYVTIQINDLFGDLTTASSGATLLGVH